MDAKQWAEQLARLHAENVELNDRVCRLTERLERLEDEIDRLKRRPAPTIERIEYRFDQLKIDTLQGTLHIGVRPEDAAGEPIWSLGEAAVPEPTIVTGAEPSPPSPFLGIRDAVHRHLDEAVPPLLIRLCEAAEYDIDPEEIDRVVADLRAQVDVRIAHYMKLSEYDATREPAAYEASVTRLTIRDVDTAIRNFVAGKRPPPLDEEEKGS
ncbi:spore germination protein GerPC [Paenibacillus sp.]|uniref:spore germination protein GerPC n=1 Tax=Paenibacillus sp. TaxID=58172 RepID=UPI002811C1C1|nr:spore germination protein GerPC [Paenibacillus sp.]